MGADWYVVTSISAVGFTVTTMADWMNCKKFLGDKYGCFVYNTPCSEYDARTEIFIYDKETITVNTTSMIGPYEISLEYHQTDISEQVNMVKFMKKNIDSMEPVFESTYKRPSNVRKCTYWTILTTIEIGELESCSGGLPDIRKYPSVKDYRQYHGYDEYCNEGDSYLTSRSYDLEVDYVDTVDDDDDDEPQ